MRSASAVSSSVALNASTSWCGKLADEPDRVGQEVAAAVVAVGAGRRVQRVEEPLPHPGPGAGHRVEEGRLAGVRVPGERDDRERRAAAAGAHDLAVSLQARQAATQVRDAVARQAAVGLDLRLAGAPGADPATEPLEVGPQAPHPREVVLELGQLHLELALGAVGVVGEDVEDHRRPVDHRHAETLLEVALLPRNELVVAGDEVRVRARRSRPSPRRASRGRDSGRDPARERTWTTSPTFATPAVRRSSLSSARGSPSPGEADRTPTHSAR